MTMIAQMYDPKLQSLADLHRQIEARNDLPRLRRRDMISAIRTLAAWFKLPEENVPASAKYMRDMLSRTHAITENVSPRRVQNVRSLVLAAMREMGISTKLAPYGFPLSRQWEEVRGLLIGDTYATAELTRFMRYCSAHGISPTMVSDTASQNFLAAIDAESLIANPRTRHQSMCRVWNKMAEKHGKAGWPQLRLSVPRYDERLYRIDAELISSGVQNDIDAYLAHLAGQDIFVGLPKPFRPKSIKAVEGHIWRYLSALHYRGVDLQAAPSFDALLAPNFVKQGLGWHLERNGQQASKYIGEIAWSLRCYAVKYRVPGPETTKFFAEILPKLRKPRTGLSEKNVTAMAQFDDPATVDRFLLLPHRLWDLALSKPKTVETCSPRQQAQLMVQTAVAIEILQFAPMRIENLNNLRLDRHLTWQGKRLRIVIPAHEVKNDQSLDFLLAEATTERIARYIKDWRRLFLPESNPYLFPGRDGKAKDRTALRIQIEKTLWAEAAIRLTPHQFRHASAKILLDARPGHYEVVRKLLGHKSMATTYSHYAGAETQAAVELYAEVISDHRRSGTARHVPQTQNSPRVRSDLFIDPFSLMGKAGRGQK